MSIHPVQLKRAVNYTLKKLGAYSVAAEVLILGTIAKESCCGRFLYQLNGGPARGIGQMEPATEVDIWGHHIIPHSKQFRIIAMTGVSEPNVDALTFNIMYQIVMMRLHYLRVSVQLPKYDDITAMGEYWDTYYNCNPNHGTPEEFVTNYSRYILDV